MKGYKMLLNDMGSKYGDMTYELDKEYSMDKEEISLCECGYHFCDNIEDTLIYYHTFINNRLFEVDTLDGYIIKDIHNRKNVSNKIKLIREISKEEINKYIEDNIDKLVKDKYWIVRKTVAKQGYGLDILINDKYWFVRATVADQGYGLDILINDKDQFVRESVARQGYGLDILINDKSAYVREAVARQGYRLDILINDKDWFVRATVAEQGYGLDILINDENWIVRKTVVRQGYSKL